jgi:hypothetical protein
MDINQYTKEVCDFIDRLSDKEFEELLLRSGIENCPLEDSELMETEIVQPVCNSKPGVYKPNLSYSGAKLIVTQEFYFQLDAVKVA